MGYLFKRYIAPIVLILSLLPQAKAGGLVAGDFSYTCTNPAINAYRFDLVVYADCQSTGNLPSNVLMDYESSCLNADLNLALIDSSFVIQPCSSSSSCCQNPGAGCLNAVKSYHYRGSINNLPACSDWVFSAMVCCRSQSLTNSVSPGNYELFLESTLDNTLPLNNSNPTLNSVPLIQSCDGELQNWTMDASDPDGDSLYFELLPPQGFGAGVSTPVPYTAGYSHTGPVDVVGNFNLNGQNGDLSFLPTGLQASITSVRITEFRNGLVISQSFRDVFVWVINCSNQAPEIASINPVSGMDLIDSNRLGICPNLPGQVDFVFADPDLDSIFLHEQISNQLPGSNVSPIPSGFRLSWTPTLADTGLHRFDFTLRDDGCDYPRENSFRFLIQVGEVLDAGPDTATYCGQAVRLSPNLGASWNWSPSSGLSSDSVRNPFANPVAPTLYVLNNSCGSDSVFVDLRGPDFQIDVGPDIAICSGIFDSLSVQVSPLAPLYLVNWLGNISGQSGDLAIIGPGDAGKVIAEVSDGRGCVVRDSLQISRSYSRWSIQASFTTPRCATTNDGAIDLNTSGGLPPYSFKIGASPWIDSSQFIGLTGGSYVFRVSDSAGCDTSLRVQLQAPAPISLNNLLIDSVDCFGASTGLIQATATGGVGAYRYELDQSGYQAAGTFGQLAAGAYTLNYRDGNRCMDSTTVFVHQPDSLQIQIVDIDTASCRDDGRVLINVTGGNLPYQSFLGTLPFTPGQWVDSLVSGTYQVSLIDRKGCADSTSLVIPTFDKLSLSAVVNDALCHGSASGSVQLSASGGLAPFFYAQNGGSLQAQNQFDSVGAGFYQYLVIDSRQCSTTVNVSVSEPSPIQVSSIPTDAICHDQPVGSVQISASGGSPSYTYQLINSNGDSLIQGFGNITGLKAGEYLIAIRDQNQCLGLDSIVIEDPPASSYQVFTDSATCYGNADGVIQVIAVPPAGYEAKAPYEFSLNGNSFEADGYWTNLQSGNQEIVIQDRDGCLDTLNQLVYSKPKIRVKLQPAEVLIPLGRQYTPQLTFSGFSTSGFDLQWSPAQGLSCDQCQKPLITVGADTRYTVVATDIETGCKAVDTLLITIRDPKPVFVPNIFTPNNDGNNDVLFLYANDILEVSMIIFNRWGEKVFVSNSPFEGWDGTYKGAPARNGVYHYQVSGSYLSGEPFDFSGNVALVR